MQPELLKAQSIQHLSAIPAMASPTLTADMRDQDGVRKYVAGLVVALPLDPSFGFGAVTLHLT